MFDLPSRESQPDLSDTHCPGGTVLQPPTSTRHPYCHRPRPSSAVLPPTPFAPLLSVDASGSITAFSLWCMTSSTILNMPSPTDDRHGDGMQRLHWARSLTLLQTNWSSSCALSARFPVPSTTTVPAAVITRHVIVATRCTIGWPSAGTVRRSECQCWAANLINNTVRGCVVHYPVTGHKPLVLATLTRASELYC